MDVEHPTEPNRTFLGDFRKEVGEVSAKLREQGRSQWSVHEVDKIYARTLAQYYGPEPPEEEREAAEEEEEALE